MCDYLIGYMPFKWLLYGRLFIARLQYKGICTPGLQSCNRNVGLTQESRSYEPFIAITITRTTGFIMIVSLVPVKVQNCCLRDMQITVVKYVYNRILVIPLTSAQMVWLRQRQGYTQNQFTCYHNQVTQGMSNHLIMDVAQRQEYTFSKESSCEPRWQQRSKWISGV